MQLADVTPLIITKNERPNIARTLAALSWARRIVVMDSGSTDGTLEILRADPRITVVDRAFDTFAGQCNAGLEHVASEWVLSLDADYVFTSEVIAEIAALPDQPPADGYSARFQYWIYGKPIRGALYPPRTVLYRRAKARYRDDGHGHRVGRVPALAKSMILVAERPARETDAAR